MKLWIARNENKRLYLYRSEPSKGYDDIIRQWYWGCHTCESIELPEDMYPEVTWENSPQEVELKLV